MKNPAEKILRLNEALSWRKELRGKSCSLAVTNGCFDILHRGHASYLYEASLKADSLLVLVNSDASVRRVKGENRPIIDEDDRAYMLASLESVSAVVLFDTTDCTGQLQALEPDVYVKGGDYTPETLVQEEYKLLKAMGVRIELIPPVAGLSTSALIERILATAEER